MARKRPPRKLNVNSSDEPVLEVRMDATVKNELVYLLQSNKSVSYPNGPSRVVYIGTTMRGLWRIAGSAADRIYQAKEDLRGCRRLHAFIAWVNPNKPVKGKAWKHLERAMLIRFRQIYGDVPTLNVHGINYRDDSMPDCFTNSALEYVLRKYS